MARTARRPGPPSFLFGVWGQGETSKENIDALLSEFIEGLGEVTPRFLIPLDKEITTDTILDVADWALENKYGVEVIEAAPVRVKTLREIKQEADKVHEADDKDNPIEKVFADVLGAKAPDDARLLFLWAETDGEPDEDDQRVLFDCIDQKVVALDLTQGLDALGAGEDEEGGGADAAGDDAEPEEATVRDWPIRRIRTHAQEVAAKRRKAKDKGVPSDAELDDLGKNELLAFLYGDEPEPEKPTRSRRAAKTTEAEPEEGVSPRRARQMREDSEKEGTDSSTRNRRRGAAQAAEPAQDAPEPPAEGDDGGELALDRLRDALAAISLAVGEQDEDAENEAWVDFADAFADVVINRIAARVEKEPEASDIRKEIAPPRPPGKPRNDGKTPTRRRTRA